MTQGIESLGESIAGAKCFASQLRVCVASSNRGGSDHLVSTLGDLRHRLASFRWRILVLPSDALTPWIESGLSEVIAPWRVRGRYGWSRGEQDLVAVDGGGSASEQDVRRRQRVTHGTDRRWESDDLFVRLRDRP